MTPPCSSENDQIVSVNDRPTLPEVPPLANWGVWDKDGQKDEFGTLNFLTPEVIRNAAKEVHEGVSISLK